MAVVNGRKPGSILFGAVVRPLQAFLRLEAASAILLVACAAGALAWANLHPASHRAVLEWRFVLGSGDRVVAFDLHQLVNDGLMAIFFFLVGMEIKRELAVGELDTPARAALPGIAALGGMIVPAGLFLAVSAGTPGAVGWGVPMATDIAFCIGVLRLAKRRVPASLLAFVTALAIFDDLGGILVIALFYGHGLSAAWLAFAGVVGLALLAMNRAHVSAATAWIGAGAILWCALHEAGIHATIAGVALGLAIPVRPRRPAREVLGELARHVVELDGRPADEELGGAEILLIEERLEELEPPLPRFVHALHPWVAFGIMPVFAVVNSGVAIRGLGPADLVEPVALGIAIGLLIGKPLGIFAFTAAAVRLGIAPMPRGATTGSLFGVSLAAGIGFTVALFIGTLAYHDAPALLEQAKVGILLGSGGSAALALAWFGRTPPAESTG